MIVLGLVINLLAIGLNVVAALLQRARGNYTVAVIHWCFVIISITALILR